MTSFIRWFHGSNALHLILRVSAASFTNSRDSRGTRVEIWRWIEYTVRVDF